VPAGPFRRPKPDGGRPSDFEIECPAVYAAIQCLMLLPGDTPGLADAWRVSRKMYWKCKELGWWYPIEYFTQDTL
jgi:hypothetical protein